MKLYHFSNTLPASGGTVDPKKFGANEYTRKDKQVHSLPKSFFYLDPKKREERFGAQTPLFKGDIPDSEVYDFDEDKHGIKKPGANITTMIAAVLRKKYKGVKYGNVVAMFKPVPVVPAKIKLSREDVVNHAREYHEKHKSIFGLDRSMDHPAPKFDPELSKRTAAAFEKAKHTPNHPKVKAAYDQLAKEIEAQHSFLVNKGVKFTPWEKEGQPYANSKEMSADVHNNGHLYYFPSQKGQGQGEVENPSISPEVNDKFRAVHDYFGHAMTGNQFGPKGELQAWGEHAKMFSPLARLALTTETHGQNSWVNFGPHSHLPVTERPYAAQKATILPKNVIPLSRFGVPPVTDVRRPANAKHIYAWIKPDGETIHVPASQHHRDVAVAHGFGSSDHAMQNGWLRVSSAGATLDGMNFIKTPNLKQLRALKDLAISSQYEEASVNDRKLRLARGWEGNDLMGKLDGPEGWIAEDGTYHANEEGPYGHRHLDTLRRLGHSSLGSGIRAGLMHVGNDGGQLLGHRSDRGYTALQLSKLKSLAREANLDAGITTTQNGTVTTRSLKLSREEPPHGWITPEGDHHSLGGLKLHKDIMDPDEAYGRGWMHVSSDGESNLIGHHPEAKYTSQQLSKLKKLTTDHNYVGMGVTSVSNGRRATRMLKLARPHEPTEVAKALWPKIGDAGHRAILADHLEEIGDPLHHVLRGEPSDYFHTTGRQVISGTSGDTYFSMYRSPKDPKSIAVSVSPKIGGIHEVWHHSIVPLDAAKDILRHHFGNMVKGQPSTRSVKEDFGSEYMTYKQGKAREARELLSLAKAPAGGMIVNNQYFEGGKFLPRAFESIRTVRKRKLKLSRHDSTHDALWEKFENDPEDDHARLILADYLDEIGDPLHHVLRSEENSWNGRTTGKTAFLPLASHPTLDLQHGLFMSIHDNGKVRVSLHPREEGEQPRTLWDTQISKEAAKEIKDHHYNDSRASEYLKPWHQEQREKLSLAKAPAGGIIVNNQYFEGGKFLPRALESIRTVRKRKLKLSREATKVLAHSWNPLYPEEEGSDWHGQVLADALADIGHPLEPFVRKAKKGTPLIPATDPERSLPSYSTLPGRRRPHGTFIPRIKGLEAPELGIHRVGFHYDPKTEKGHIIVSMQTGPEDTPTRAYSWHAPASKEELKSLGLKSRRMKLSREDAQSALWPKVSTDPHARLALADLLAEDGDPLEHVLRSPKSPKLRALRPMIYNHQKKMNIMLGAESQEGPYHHVVITQGPGIQYVTAGPMSPEIIDQIKATHVPK